MSSKEKPKITKSWTLNKNFTFTEDKLFQKSFFRKNSKFNSKEKLNPKSSYNLQFSSSLTKIVNENDEYNSDNSQDTEYNENREKQLDILNKKYTKLYNSKENIYANIINEIEVEKRLFYKGSINSFNILILKIKCFFKLIKEKIENALNSKDERNFYEVDMYIQKIKQEFIKIYSKLDENSKYEYEIITQIYCKFLFIMAIISNKKDEYLRSFSYISLGINMLKVYFIRQKVALDIGTYKIYAKFLILLINKLITDNNISQSLIYCSLLSKICEIGLNFIFKKKLDKKYEYKFNKYNGYNFLFLGYCYELRKNTNNNNIISLKFYREAFYFMTKSFNLSNPLENKSIITIEKKGLYLSQFLYEKLKDKLIYDALEKKRNYEQQEIIKKQLLEEAKSKEKKYKLKLISSGISPQTENLVKIQQKIYNEILTPNNQKLIEKLDDELISYVYKDRQNGNNNKKKDIIKLKKKKLNEKAKTINIINTKSRKVEKRFPSIEIMKNLCHYKIYNSLMSNDFKEFLLNNKKLQFYHPQKQKISLDRIQKYLNRKMEIDSNLENSNKEKEKESFTNLITETNISSENNIKAKILNLNHNNKNKVYKLYLSNNKNNTEKSFLSNYSKFNKKNPPKTNRPLTTNNTRSFIISKDKDIYKDKKDSNSNKKRIMTYLNYIKSSNLASNKNNRTINSKSFLNSTADLEKRELDKYIFNKKYFKQYVYMEKLSNKELDFQKQFLESKNNNSKMYFKRYITELSNNGKISRDEIYNSFLILNDKVKIKDIDYEKEIELNNKTKIISKVFKIDKSKNKNKEKKEIQNTMKKVLDNYIREGKKKKTNKLVINAKEINKKNEYSIMKLNDNIKEINYLLVSKNNEMKNNNNNFFLKYNDI